MGPVKNHRWIYACAKQLLERVLHAYGIEEGLNYSIIRPFNFIGPRIDYLPSEQTGNPQVFSHFMNGLLYGTDDQARGRRSQLPCLHIHRRRRRLHRANHRQSERLLRPPDLQHRHARERSRRSSSLPTKMIEIFDKHFRKPGDPTPEIIDVSSEEFYGKGYEDCDRRIPNVDKARTLLRLEVGT